MPEYFFRNEGDYWTIAFRGSAPILLQDIKGLKYIAYLLSHPAKEIHAMELYHVVNNVDPMERMGVTSNLHESELGDLGHSVSGFGDAGPLLDNQAKSEYQSRIRDLQTELAEAESYNDTERAHVAREEITAFEQQLAEAFGLGGRPRKAANASENARQAVSRAIDRSLKKIESENPSLWLHLSNSIKKGTFLAYVPESPIDWEF